jgi:enterochelin esterase-like enzyme
MRQWLMMCVVVGSVCVPHAAAAQDSARVVLVALASKTFGNTRMVRVYLPPGYHDKAQATRRYPVLFMNDGFAVFSPRSWNAPALLDSLIVTRRIAPMILVGIDNAASIAGTTTPDRDRTNEYLPYPDSLEPELPNPQGMRYPEFVTGEVLPLIGQRFRVSNERNQRGVGGSSYGAIAALYTVLQKPDVFGKLLLESTPLFLFGFRLVEEARHLSQWPERVYVGLGTQETNDPAILARANHPGRDFVAVARDKLGAERVLYHLVAGARHSPQAWRARFPTALQFLFPVTQ